MQFFAKSLYHDKIQFYLKKKQWSFQVMNYKNFSSARSFLKTQSFQLVPTRWRRNMWKEYDSKRKVLSESLPGYCLHFSPLPCDAVLYSLLVNNSLPTTVFTSEISRLDHYVSCVFCWVSKLSFLKNLFRISFITRFSPYSH